MKTITPYLISKLYTWTIKDLDLIYNRCFDYNHQKNRDEGPSSAYSIIIAVLFDIWGSIIQDQFGKEGKTKNNVEHILKLLYKKDPNNYEIYDSSQKKIRDDIVEIFRHNLIHNIGKKPKRAEFDLNIDTMGKAINQQTSNKRWHINCKKLKEDFLNLLRLELPEMLQNK